MCRTKSIKAFNASWRKSILENPDLKNDKPAKKLAWSEFKDQLCKSGVITLKQYENWA